MDDLIYACKTANSRYQESTSEGSEYLEDEETPREPEERFEELLEVLDKQIHPPSEEEDETEPSRIDLTDEGEEEQEGAVQAVDIPVAKNKSRKRKRKTIQTTMSGKKQIQGHCICMFCGYSAPHYYIHSSRVFDGDNWPYKGPVYVSCPECFRPAMLTNVK